MSEIDRTLIGKRIKERREINGLTQEQVGNMIDKKFTTVAKYESGEIKKIDIMVIAKIAEITNTNIEYLLLKSNSPEKREELKNTPLVSDLNKDIAYNTFCYKAINDEMAPLLDTGDIAIVEKIINNKFTNKCTYLMKFKNEIENKTEIIIRKIIDNKDGTLDLVAMSPYHKTITTTKDKVEIIGKVLEAHNSSAFK